MKSQTGTQTVMINILPHKSKRADNQTIKFCQLMQREKYFPLKMRQKMSENMRQGDYFQTSNCFFKELYIE